MTDLKPAERPILRMPLKNFKPIGPLTPEAEEWWMSYGRHLDSARRDWDKRRNAE